ncbi:hypothetical protein GRJ2_002967700 [Grus japonensis]|uniref:Uncharacterized protein n=1 Tax=Grus japonensis TaxID=30415 RepID=A0ABC9Y637_GRUJA
MLMQSPKPPDIAQIKKLIVPSKDWDGNIWGDSNNNSSDDDNSPHLPEPPVLLVRPIIKTEVTTGPRGGVGNHITKTTPFDAIQIANLQERYSRKPQETETEYVWRVSLTGGDRILLNGDEANAFWGPGVFLNAGPNPPDQPHSLTSRVAYWAGGIDILERGEPPLIPIKCLNELSVAFIKAACIQAMHQHDPIDVPVLAPVDPTILKKLIKGAPATLKPFFIAKRDEIQRDLNHNELINLTRAVGENEDIELVRREVPTWEVLMHETIKHAREIGWNKSPSETKNTGHSMRQIKQSHQKNSKEPKSSDRQLKGQKGRNEIWKHALALGIPRAAIQRQPTSVILSLIQAFKKRSAQNTLTPLLRDPRERDNPFCLGKDQLQDINKEN